MSNPENRILPNQKFYGGQSSDEAIGTEASFSYSRALDHRRNPSQLTVLPGPRKLSAGVVQDLILNIVQTQTGLRYAYGENGNIYKISTGNVINYFSKLPTGSDGCIYRTDADAIYFATQTDVRRLWPISGTPTLDQTYGPSRSTDTTAYKTGGSLATGYTAPITLDEAQKFSFTPDIEPFYSVKVNVAQKGTGSLTLTLHDGLNNVLGTVTIANANLVVGLNEFVFTTPIRGFVKPNARTYHCHVTSTVADTILAGSTLNALSSVDFELWASRLIRQNNGFHPMAQFLQYTLIGNSNYLAVWEPLSEDAPNTEFLRHRLTFPTGFEVCGIAVTDEFAVIAIEKYATDGTKDFQEGKLIIWDGISQTYNQIVDVSGGSPEAIQSHDNYPYFFVNGNLCAWPGGKNTVKIRTIPNSNLPYRDVVDNTRAYPNMMAIRDGMLHAGYPSYSNNTAIEYGVYVWGTLEKNYPASFNYGYVNSSLINTNTTNNLRHGCVRNFGDEMYISVQYADGNYGLEIVDSLCDPAPVAKFRALRFTAGAAYRKKLALKVGIDTAPLPASTVITPTYRIDSNAEVTIPEAALGVNDEQKVGAIKQGNFKRMVTGFDVACSGPTSPTIFATTLEWNPLADRRGL
jgi:hypothetical protein